MATKQHYINLCDSIIEDLMGINFNRLSPNNKKEYSNLKVKLGAIKNELKHYSGTSKDHDYIYGMGDHTLQEIANTTGITRERVRQIEVSAIKKLRHPKTGKKLRSYLEN